MGQGDLREVARGLLGKSFLTNTKEQHGRTYHPALLDSSDLPVMPGAAAATV